VIRRLLAAAVPVAVLWFLGGSIGLLAGAAMAAWDLLRQPPARHLLRASVLLFALVPVAVLARGLPSPATVGPAFASRDLVAHGLAGAALALLVLGILREVRPPSALPAAGDPPGGRALATRDGAPALAWPGEPAGEGPAPRGDR